MPLGIFYIHRRTAEVPAGQRTVLLATSYLQLLIVLPGNGPQRYAFIPARTAISEAHAAGVPLWLLRQVAPGRLGAQGEAGGQADAAVLPVRRA